MTSDLAHAAGRDSRPSAVEWWLVAAIFLTGLALRAAWPSRLAVEHFDEGVYASNIFFLDDPQDAVYPNQHLYAPPLVPFVIQYAMIFFGAANGTALAANIFAGSLTVPLVWWAGRCWFGPTAGLAAATLVALNDVHIFFSRTALTDVWLCFWLLAAVYFAWDALATGRWLPLLVAGVATGLAWWTKYSGWLPLAISLAGLIPWRLFGDLSPIARRESLPNAMGKDLHSLADSLGRWGILTLVTFVIWLPWLWDLQSQGGYSAVAANHRGYIVGPSGWWNSLTLQTAKLQRLDGVLSWIAPGLALLVCVLYVRLSGRRCTWNALVGNRLLVLGLPVFGLCAIVYGCTAVLAIITIGGMASRFVWRDRSGTVASNSEPRWLSLWMLTAWFIGLSLTIPLYAPYPRLILPWLMACWMGAGMAINEFTKRGVVKSENANPVDDRPAAVRLPLIGIWPAKLYRWERIVLGLAFTGFFGLFLAAIGFVRAVPGWETRTSLADLSPTLIEDVCRRAGVPAADDHQLVIYTYGEPALLFQLRLAGARLVRPVQSLAAAAPESPLPKLPSFIVVGPQARRTPGFADDFARGKPRLGLVESYRYRPSNLVLLDRQELPGERIQDDELEVYQLR